MDVIGGSGVLLGTGVFEGFEIFVGGSGVTVNATGFSVGLGVGVSAACPQILTRKVSVIVGVILRALGAISLSLLEQLTDKSSSKSTERIMMGCCFINFYFVVDVLLGRFVFLLLKPEFINDFVFLPGGKPAQPVVKVKDGPDEELPF